MRDLRRAEIDIALPGLVVDRQPFLEVLRRRVVSRHRHPQHAAIDIGRGTVGIAQRAGQRHVAGHDEVFRTLAVVGALVAELRRPAPDHGDRGLG